MISVSAVLQLLNEKRFDEAVPLVRRALTEAERDSAERLIETARPLLAWKGFFSNSDEASRSEGYFREVHGSLSQLTGAESPAAMAAAENLAGLLGSIGKVEEAIPLREKVFQHVKGRFPFDDPRFIEVREGLGFLYRRAGRDEALAELYRDLGLCRHLTAAEQYIRSAGGKLVSCGRPWSAHCHLWAYFDAQLDCEGLIEGLGLDPCVRIHDHRGTHDGSERGLVCTIHHDALLGPHPTDTAYQNRVIGMKTA
ncbi:MAG TPA: hypothetical protein VL285_26800 [Bryobacteraceae bacterium]|jgi:hypothetical protein|nr:hypothetical protein [Bryobacteraceae bacterium]